MAANQSNIKISALAKELKMKSGKELIEKLKALGFDDVKSTSSSIVFLCRIFLHFSKG